jgi:FkbM family methyltransferase
MSSGKSAVVVIGSLVLQLDLNNPHEKDYYTNKCCLDAVIIENIVRPGWVAVDLGANIGFITAHLARMGCSRIYAVEPLTNLYNRLNMLAVQDNRIKTIPTAVGADNGRQVIFVSKTHNQGHSLNPLWPEKFKDIFGNEVATEEITVARFDALGIADGIDYIKVDIEGSNTAFIRGASGFFASQRPILQIEIYDFELAEIRRLLECYYSHCRRAIANPISKALYLVHPQESGTDPDADYLKQPPTYLFYNDDHLGHLHKYHGSNAARLGADIGFPIPGTGEIIACTDNLPFGSVLDVGVGNGSASLYFAQKGKTVTAVGLNLNSYGLPLNTFRELGITLHEGHFESIETAAKYDALWLSHVLEHTQNVGLFLAKARSLLNDSGWLFVMVPPYKPQVVGGHITNGWNMGQLLYNLLLAGFDIKNGHFAGIGYNICAFVQKAATPLPPLRMDIGDIEATKDLWPVEVFQGFNGNIPKINWFN